MSSLLWMGRGSIGTVEAWVAPRRTATAMIVAATIPIP